jgi:hypothetical protein
MTLQLYLGPWSLFQFLDLFTADRTPWKGDYPVARPLPTQEQHKQNKRTQTSMPRVGFKPTVPVFELAKTVRSLNRADTVIGNLRFILL